MKTVLELEDLAGKAIKAALNQQWQLAIELNQEILHETPDSIESNNRLARAFQESGQTEEARKTYARVLELDPYNSIAQKNLSKLEQGSSSRSTTIVNKELFLEEPGKTRSIAIHKPNNKKLSSHSSGEELKLEPKNDQLALIASNGDVLGYVDAALSNHLIKLIKLGNEYTAYLLNTSENPQAFLRETKQSAAGSKFISFARTSPITGNVSTPKSIHKSIDDSPQDMLSDEDLDNWDSDDSADSPASDDDFDAVSFEQMREDEESALNGRDDY